MRVLETNIDIDAAPQTVWAVLDELRTYPEWNEMLPDLAGRTTVGSTVTTTFVRPNTPVMKISPKIIRIVAARELRWLTQAPDPSAFSGEHIFRIEAKADGSCVFHNDEIFRGSLVEERWPALNTNTRDAYNAVNRKLKARAEERAHAHPALHPSVTRVATESNTLARSVLRCACPTEPVEVRLTEDVAHNHLCGCSKCWKPKDALLAQTAVVPAGTLETLKGKDKLKVVDSTQSVQRYACRACGVHMFGRVEEKDHHFYGLDFVHPELASPGHVRKPEFAGFVSSLIESGTSPTLMSSVRDALRQAAIPAFDAFSPEIMDVIAWHRVKLTQDLPS